VTKQDIDNERANLCNDLRRLESDIANVQVRSALWHSRRGPGAQLTYTHTPTTDAHAPTHAGAHTPTTACTPGLVRASLAGHKQTNKTGTAMQHDPLRKQRHRWRGARVGCRGAPPGRNYGELTPAAHELYAMPSLFKYV
jgi:hypothetical protein